MAVIAALLGLWFAVSVEAGDAGATVISFVDAEACALLADSLYANPGSMLSFESKCVLADNSVSASSGSQVSSTPILSPSAEFDAGFLRVTALAHYK